MKISRTEQGWVVQVPDDVAAALGVREGDEVHVELTRTPAERAADMAAARTEEDWRKTVEVMDRAAAASRSPAGYKFDREEANERGWDCS